MSLELGSTGYPQATYTSSGLHLCQAKYISDLLHKVNMLRAKPLKSPYPLGSKLSKFDGSVLPDPTEYHHVVRALQYFTLTCLELAFSVNQLCQHMRAKKQPIVSLSSTEEYHSLVLTTIELF